MNDEDKSIIDEFRRSLPPELLKQLKRLIVFGSRARGDAVEGSDLDVIALVDQKTPETEKALEDYIYQVMWDHDFKPIISLKVFSESKFDEAVKKGYSFYRHVKEEGVAV